MKNNRPYHRAALREIEPLPVLAAVGRPIRTVLGAEVDDLRVLGMNGNRPDLNLVGQAVAERLPVALAHHLAKQAADRPVFSSP